MERGKDSIFLQSTDYGLGTAKDAISLHHCQVAGLTHAQLAVCKDAQGEFCRAAPLAFIIVGWGCGDGVGPPSQVQHFAFIAVEFGRVPVGPLLLPV